MRQKEEQDAKAKLDVLTDVRQTTLQCLTELAHQHAADRYVLALLAHVGEAYRLLRLCEGAKAAAVLQGAILDHASVEAGVKSDLANGAPSSEGPAAESSSASVTAHPSKRSAFSICTSKIAGTPSAAWAKLRRMLAICFCRDRVDRRTQTQPFHCESHGCLLARPLPSISRSQALDPGAASGHGRAGTASTHIVVGNAFSLQKEHQTALVCFQRAAAAAPDYAYAYTLAVTKRTISDCMTKRSPTSAVRSVATVDTGTRGLAWAASIWASANTSMRPARACSRRSISIPATTSCGTWWDGPSHYSTRRPKRWNATTGRSS